MSAVSKIHVVFFYEIVYTRHTYEKEGPLMKIASFILRTSAIVLAAASVACMVVAHLCASLQDADD